MIRQIGFIFILSLLLTSCTTLNPATGKKEFIMISTQREVAMGKSVHQSLKKQYTLSTNQDHIDRVRAIGEKIAKISDRRDYKYRFFVIEQKELNAFTTPGGHVYVNSGLVERMNDDELAFVLAHEIAHCAARHVVKKYQAGLGYSLIGNVLSQVDGGVGTIASLSSGALKNLVFSAYSRKDELEADKLGVKYVYLAGYDMQGAVSSFEILQEESKGKPKMPTMLRSHPHLDDRIGKIEVNIKRVPKYFKPPN